MREQDIDDERDDFDDDLNDDFWAALKEEPDCLACNDGGCRECRPTRVQHWWFRSKWRVIGWWSHIRWVAKGRPDVDRSPF